MLCPRIARCPRGELLHVTTMRAVGSRAPSPHAIGVAQLVAWGVTFYAIPPLLPGISRGVGASMSVLSVALTVGLLLNAVASLAVASWIRRGGARAPMVAGSIAASFALIVLASSQSGPMAFTAIAILGSAHAALLYEPAFAAVSMQTRDPIARARAIQVITLWGGWAALWAVPTASVLGGWLGWRATLFLLSALLAAHTIRVHSRLPPPILRAAPTSEARPPPISLGLAVAFALGSFATTAMVVNGLLLLADRDVSVRLGAIVFALLAPPQVLGRLWFMRRKGRLGRHDGSLPFVLVASGIGALLAAPHVASLAIFVVLFGAGTGLLTTMRAAVVVLRVAPEHVAMQLGTYSFATSVARALAPAVSSWIFFCAGYESALLVFAAMSAVAALLVWRATACACANLPRSACSSWVTGGDPGCSVR